MVFMLFILRHVTSRLRTFNISMFILGSSRPFLFGLFYSFPVRPKNLKVVFFSFSVKKHHNESRTEVEASSNATETPLPRDSFTLRIFVTSDSSQLLDVVWDSDRGYFVSKLPKKFQKGFKLFDLSFHEERYDLKLIQFMVEGETFAPDCLFSVAPHCFPLLCLTALQCKHKF